MLVAEQKGRNTKQKLFRNFGMPKPEGYRKALRTMQMAAKFGRPMILSWIPREPIRASTPKSAGRPKRSPATCAKWRAWACP